jgi:hypothetical protein
VSFFRLVWRRIGFVTAGIAAIYLIVHAFEPARLNWGDPVSDFNVMTSGRNFARYGFRSLHFTPLLIDQSVMTPRDSGMIYTHYPQLPDLANGVLRVVFRIDSLAVFRLCALLVTAGSLFFVFQLVRAYWGEMVAQIAFALWVLNPLWVQHADYLHHGPYAFFFGFGALYFTWRSFERSGFAWLAGAFLCLAFLSSYDIWLFAPLMMAAMVAHRYGAPWRLPAAKVLIIGAGGALLAITLKLATNAWALGGPARMLADLRYQIDERATSNVVKTAFATGMLPTLIGRVDREFTLLLIPVTLFWLLWPWIRHRQSRLPDVPNPIILLIGAIPFLIIFRELWVAQYYPFLLLVPFWAIGTAILVDWCVGSANRVIRLGGAAAAMVMAVGAIGETVEFPRAFLSDSAIASLEQQIPRYVPPGQRILTNLIVDAPYRYYVSRDVVPVMVHEAYRLPMVLDHFTDPSHPEFAGPDGAVLVLHRNARDALFDKGYYYILAPYKLWSAWGEPQRYRRQIDSIVDARDAMLLRIAQAVGQKLYDSDQFSLWRIPPASRWQISPKANVTPP